MSHSLWPLILILLSLAGVVILLIKKFPQLSVLDIETIPEVKEAKKKTAILQDRVEKEAAVARVRRALQWQPILGQLKRCQAWFRRYVGRLERRMIRETERLRHHESKAAALARTEELRTLLNDGRFALEKGEWDNAEKNFLAAIRLDTKNKEAYRGLGDLYVAKEQYDEAKETYKFLLRLDRRDDQTYTRLGEIAEKQNQLEAAVEYYQQAVLINPNLGSRFAKIADLLVALAQYPTAMEAAKQAVDLEPANPKYLDNLAEISILAGEKTTAEEAYQALRMANPDNQKLPSLKDKITQLPS